MSATRRTRSGSRGRHEYPKELALNHQGKQLQRKHFQTFVSTLIALAIDTDPIAKGAPDGGKSLRRDWERAMKPGIDRIVALLGTGPHSAPEY